jgi:hypothetical protein
MHRSFWRWLRFTLRIAADKLHHEQPKASLVSHAQEMLRDVFGKRLFPRSPGLLVYFEVAPTITAPTAASRAAGDILPIQQNVVLTIAV